MREPQAVSWFRLLYQGIGVTSSANMNIPSHHRSQALSPCLEEEKNVTLYCKGTRLLLVSSGWSLRAVCQRVCNNEAPVRVPLPKGRAGPCASFHLPHTLEVFCGKPRCLHFLFILKFLKLVPQFQNQSPETIYSLLPYRKAEPVFLHLL